MTPQNSGLDIVVVAYGSPATLAGALAPVAGAYPILVIDNSSSPPIEAIAKDAGAQYVDPGVNLGFAAAVNLGLSRLDDPGRDVLLLNPDARIDQPALARLHQELRSHPELACVAPSQHAPGSSVPSRARWPWHTPSGAWAEAVGLGRRRLASPKYFLGGAILLVRKSALAEVGTFDERFFLYCEDEDWQRRAVGRGWHVRFCPEIEAEHVSGGSQSDIVRLQLRLHAAIERYVRKWYGPWGWAVFRAGTLFGHSLRLLVHTGARRRTSARLARLYVTGPDRTARHAGVVPAT
jgi:GT2 family glycosyltransferase